MLEREFQAEVVRDLRSIFPDATVILPDSSRQQGIADIIILIEGHWAALEVKRSAKAPYRPNQEYYIEKYKQYTYAAFIYPENKEEILNEIQRAFPQRGTTCISGSK